MPDRYIVEAEDWDEHAVRQALTFAVAIAGTEGAGILLLTDTATALNPAALCLVLTHREQRDLTDRQPVFVRGVPIRHDSIEKLRGYYWRDVAVVLWPTRESLASLDVMVDCRAIIVVPWLPDHCDQWRRRWDPVVVRDDGERPGPA